MGMGIRQELERLERQIQEGYAKYTIIDDVCMTSSVEPTVEAGKFRKIANDMLIERERITNPSNYLLLDEIGASVARGETEYLVRNLTLNCPSREVGSVTYDTIAQEVDVLTKNRFTPNHVFMPIEYAHNVREWNKSMPREVWAKMDIFNTIYINEDTIMKVTFSNKYVPFEKIIISSKQSNRWDYRPNEDRSSRLTAKFDWDYKDPLNALLIVRTIFDHVIDRRGNLVISPVHNDNVS
jgi:hypothetical protein